MIDQCPTLADGTTPNPRYGTRVPDGRFWNPHNSQTYQSIRPISDPRDLMFGKSDADKSLPLLSTDAAPVPFYQGSWLYGTKRTREGTG